jgi:hypothetical protein
MHILTTGQLVGLAKNIDTDALNKAVIEIEQAQSKLANLIATEYGIEHRSTEFDIDCEVGSSFAPAYRGQTVPQEMLELDIGSDWARDPENVDAAEPKTINGTLYIAPGNRTSRIYAIPYIMKKGQSPADLLPNHQRSWVQVGTMAQDGKIVALNPAFLPYRNDLEGSIAGTYMEAEWQAPQGSA